MALLPADGFVAVYERSEIPLFAWQSRDGYVNGLVLTESGKVRPAESLLGFKGYRQSAPEAGVTR